MPFKVDKLGAAQLKSWKLDFEKLATAKAPHRFFFVADPVAFGLVRDVYAQQIPGVRVVLLTTGESFDCPI